MWLDLKTNTIIYDLPADTLKRVSVLPGALALANGYVALPITLYNLQLLRWIGLPVPEALRDYDWPGQYTPFAVQRITANFLALHPRSLCLNDMGTGKTLAALWASDFVMQKLPGVRTLVVAPLSTLQRVWADAVFKNFLGRRSAIILHGDADKRRELLAKHADYYIINYDGIKVIRKELSERKDIDICIIDEASAYRNGGTSRHKLARELIAPKSYLWLLTGTPTPNQPTDAWGLAKLINNAGGESYRHFHDRVMYRLSQWVWVPKQGAHEMAHALMQPSIRFSIEDCMDLPPCTTQMRDVELSIEQRKAYAQMKNECVLLAKQGQITAVNEAVVRLKLLQIVQGAIYGDKREINLIDASPRLSVLRETMEECSGKIIVFAPLTSVLNMLNKELGKEYECEIINGEVSSKARADIFARFEDTSSPRVLIADPATMSHGLTLVAAKTIIWYGPTDRPELYQQANKRIDRPGQSVPTTIVQLAATAIEREIYKRLAAKENMQGLVLKLARGEL